MRRISLFLLAIGCGTGALACSPEERAALKQLGCSEERIKKRCTRPTDPVINLRPVQPPGQGVLASDGPRQRVAPFRITTPGDGSYYFIKLVEPGDRKRAVLTLFVNSGSSYQTKAPLGTYVVRYASGTQWYGQKRLFGPCQTQFHQADALLEFRQSGNKVTGHHIELVKQAGGNLSTSGVDEDDW